ncbi:MAG: ComF family protein [Flavobacteriales bacterium]|nr:ComF family protein [Flavobacteriales bacterium]
MILENLANLFFPKRCLTCDETLQESEKLLCTFCLHDLPLANYTAVEGNQVEKSFYGRIPLTAATALLLFTKNSKVQQLIHQLKYKGFEEIGTYLGDWLGEELVKSGRFKSTDMVIPVPLHPKKLKIRGYNQVEKFGKSLAKQLHAQYVDDKLLKITTTESQTHKHRSERVSNVNEIFVLADTDYFKNRQVLLIDDIITTGATLESCCRELLKVKGIKISIATMAATLLKN